MKTMGEKLRNGGKSIWVIGQTFGGVENLTTI